MNGCYRICFLNDYSSGMFCLRSLQNLETSILNQMHPRMNRSTDELHFNFSRQCFHFHHTFVNSSPFRRSPRVWCLVFPRGNPETKVGPAKREAYADTEVCHYTLLAQPGFPVILGCFSPVTGVG